LKNEFHQQVKVAEEHCVSDEELKTLLGRGRAKKGMFEGDLTEGELEIGQVSSMIHEIKPAAEIVMEIFNSFRSLLKRMGNP
jgi:enoyl-[acyl-carrier protein] reductase II